MAAVTRLALTGIPAAPYGSFAGKSPAAPSLVASPFWTVVGPPRVLTVEGEQRTLTVVGWPRTLKSDGN